MLQKKQQTLDLKRPVVKRFGKIVQMTMRHEPSGSGSKACNFYDTAC